MTIDTLPGQLSGIHLLGSLPSQTLAELERNSVWRRFGTGEQIVDRNSQSRDVFFVAEGRVQVVNYSFSGREVAYAGLAAGDFFGELSAIDGEPRSASVVALENCLIAALAPELFQNLLRESPDIGRQVMLRLARIIRTCDERIMDLSTLGAVQRVHVELLRMATPDPVTKGSWLIYPLPTQQQIAGRVSTTRETVARVLSHLQTAGLVRRKEKTLYLTDRTALEHLTERLGAQQPEAIR